MSSIIQGTNTGNLELVAGTNQSIVFTTDSDGSINLNALATQAYVASAVSSGINAIIDGAPAALNTLNEIAAAIADDANFSTGLVSILGTKANVVDVYTKNEVDVAFQGVDTAKQNAFVPVPTSSVGQAGHTTGMIAINGSYLFYCTANFDGTSNIWARTPLTLTAW